jgi:hypothetical protein
MFDDVVSRSQQTRAESKELTESLRRSLKTARDALAQFKATAATLRSDCDRAQLGLLGARASA